MYITVSQITKIVQYTYTFWSCGIWWILRVLAFVLRIFASLFSREYVHAHHFRISTSEWGRLDIWMCFQNSFPPTKENNIPRKQGYAMQSPVQIQSSSCRFYFKPCEALKAVVLPREIWFAGLPLFPPVASKTSTVTCLYLNILIVCASTGMIFFKYRNGEGHAWHMHL